MLKSQEFSQSVILAAGYASRARPLSDEIAKPLFPVGDTCGVEWAIQLSLSLGLDPIVVTGSKSDQIERHLKNKHPKVVTLRIAHPSTNLLRSLALCEGLISSPHFLWIGGGMFFERIDDIARLISRHQEAGAFCSLFSQSHIRYKPKLVLEDGRLVKFVVGNHRTPFSAPTVFATSKHFLRYAREYDERDVFQKAIDDGKRFVVIGQCGWSQEIHTILDYFSVSKRMHLNGYCSVDSKVLDTICSDAFIYSSVVRSCRIDSSIVINGVLSNREIVNRLIYGNCIDEPISQEE